MDNNAVNETKQRSMRPKARLLRTLGSELISSDKVALTELIKNSYDADAQRVLIRLISPSNKEKTTVEVWDDGHGMDQETLESAWLDIASSPKTRKTHSLKGRRFLGEKGIGRLAVSKLGDKLTLSTRMKGQKEVTLQIDWREFNNEDLYLDEVQVNWQIGGASVFLAEGQPETATFTPAFHATHGTMIRVEEVTHAWSRQDILELRAALRRLVRANLPMSQYTKRTEERNDFEILLHITDDNEDYTDLSGPIEPAISLENPHYSLSGTVDDTGIATMEYKIAGGTTETITINLWQQTDRAPQSGPFSFEFFVWDRENKKLKDSLSTEIEAVPMSFSERIKEFKNALDEVAGISIYRDDFRVLPYGERGVDWLSLDARRIQTPTRYISNNQIIGNIFISADENPGLEDQSNREGIIEGTPYEDLRRLTLSALQTLENQRLTSRNEPKSKTVQRDKGGLFAHFSLTSLRAKAVELHPKDTDLVSLIDATAADIDKAVAEVKEILSQYSRLATLGTLVDQIRHEGRGAITRLKLSSSTLEKKLAHANISLEELSTRALELTTDVNQETSLLTGLFNQISPFGGRKQGKPQKISLKDSCERLINHIINDNESKGVSIDSDIEDTYTKIDEGDLLTVLNNLVINAVYWTRRSNNADKRVQIEIRTLNNDTLSITVSDNGPGITPDDRDKIFLPYFSTKPNGIGLGLAITGHIVEDLYEGELILKDNGALPGATFQAIFRKRVQ